MDFSGQGLGENPVRVTPEAPAHVTTAAGEQARHLTPLPPYPILITQPQ